MVGALSVEASGHVIEFPHRRRRKQRLQIQNPLSRTSSPKMPLLAEGSEVPLPNSSGATAPSEAADVPARVRIKNRRKTYLDRHPEYFGPQLELAGVPLALPQAR
jgi:hypothetical protein